MFKRPLLPFLAAFALGILTTHHLAAKYPHDLPLIQVIGLVSAILLCVASLFVRNSMVVVLCFYFSVAVVLDAQRHGISRLAQLSPKYSEQRFIGRVVEELYREKEGQGLILKVKHVESSRGWESIEGLSQVIVRQNFIDVTRGDWVLLMGRLSTIRGFRTEGYIERIKRWKLQGIYTRITVPDGRYIVKLPPSNRGLFDSGIAKIRALAKAQLPLQGEKESIPVLWAILLGDKGSIPKEQREEFQRAGLSHVLVVSGLHVGLWATVCFFGIRWVLIGTNLFWQKDRAQEISAAIACILVMLYIGITGFQVSATRAMIMALMFLLMSLIYRSGEKWNTLSFTALVLLAMDTHLLFSISFQLSFLAVAGLFWGNEILIKPIQKKIAGAEYGEMDVKRRLIVYFLSLALISLSANIFLLPFLLKYFNQVPIVGIVSNIVVVPVLSTIVIPFGMAGILVSLLSKYIGSIILKVADQATLFICYVAKVFSSFEYFVFYYVTPKGIEIVLYYAVLLILLTKCEYRKKLIASVLGFAFLVIVHLCYNIYPKYQDHLYVEFLDVGQGNSTFLMFPGKVTMLVDGGGLPNTDFDIGRNVIAPYLWKKRILQLNVVALTHPDQDHYGGLPSVIRSFRPKEFWMARAWRTPQALGEELRGVYVRELGMARDLEGDFGKARVELLHPTPKTTRPYYSLNDLSMVLKVTYGKASLLLTGDLGGLALEELGEYYGENLKSDVLLVPHHGSKSSLAPGFLRWVRPRVAVISCGGRNPFGFPHRDVIEVLRGLGAQIYSTKEHGSVGVMMKENGELSIKTCMEAIGSNLVPIED